MQELEIDVTQIEEWQTIQDIDSLDRIFMRAQQVLTGGGAVHLVRKHVSGQSHKFDELSTLEELNVYRQSVYKYLG